MTAGTRVVGYVRVSTVEQADSGAGLEAQRAAIQLACDQRGWELVGVVEDAGFSAATLDRPGITQAVEAVESGRASVLVVAKLDRLSRSLLDFAVVMERSRRKRWSLVALDLGVDTTTPAGEAMANMMATFAQFERRVIGQRTKDALAVKRAEGVRLGRPRALPGDIAKRIWRSHRRGSSLRRIAKRLNDEAIPTAHGGATWHPSTVNAVIASVRMERSLPATITKIAADSSGAGR